jgi:tRNA G10  N-methylase Trm11
MKSFLILGTNSSVSFAEIYQKVGDINIYGDSAVIVDNEEIGKNAPIILGGVPKSGTIISQLSNLDAKKIAFLLQEYITEGQKFHFGLSSYSIDAEVVSPQKLKAIGLEIKKILKQSGASVRLVESKSKTLSSVDVVKNKLIDKGVELCLFFTKEGILIGKTESVQRFEEYSERDYGRPSRDMKRGMIPPKLAKSMINLSGAKEEGLILDPFCGVGTIPQEALLLGYETMGTDIDEQAIKQSNKNIQWLLDKNKEQLPEHKFDTIDVRKLNEIVSEKSVDAIVAEFDLGPPHQGSETEVKIQSIERSLSEFYAQALEMMHYVLKDGERAVIAWPYFVKQDIAISLFNSLLDIGWNIIEPYPQEYKDIYSLSKRNTLLYGRDDQHVFREIIILEKK